jgi:hypothetical protein
VPESKIVLEGKVKEFVRSEAGNLAFMLEDSRGNIHYCFSQVKTGSLGISDEVIVHGTLHSGNKVRLSYLVNKTRNTEEMLIETKQSWAYSASLTFSILVTAGFVVSLLILVGIIPIGTGSTFDNIFRFVLSLILVILLLPVLIILWVLTSAFGKKRKESEALKEDITKMKGKVGISEPSKTVIAQKEFEAQAEPYSAGAMKFCSHCGEKLAAEAKFCSKCGAKWE